MLLFVRQGETFVGKLWIYIVCGVPNARNIASWNVVLYLKKSFVIWFISFIFDKFKDKIY